MVRLRHFDHGGIRDYLTELQPKFLMIRIRTGNVQLRWAVPSWAVEEVIRFGVRMLPLLPGLARWLPERAGRHLRRFAIGAGRRPIWGILDEFFSERHRDLLVLPPGEPLVAIETRDALIEIKQVALGARA